MPIVKIPRWRFLIIVGAVMLLGLFIGSQNAINTEKPKQSPAATCEIVNCTRIVGQWTVDKDGYHGHWIHVNINNRTPRDALETCSHEVGHEIFATYCAKNMDKCLGLVDNISTEAFAKTCENNITSCMEIAGGMK